MIAQEPAFEVLAHDWMIARFAGKVPGTVLVIEQQLFGVLIHEYTDPLSWSREWTYLSLEQAVGGLAYFLANDVAPEPNGWIRSVDHGEPPDRDRVRIRRAHVEFGERVITVDEEEESGL